MLISTHAYSCVMVIAGICAVIFFLNLPLFGLIVARHYDRVFPQYTKSKEAFENNYWIFNPILRGLTYAGCIVFKNYSTKSVRKSYLNYFFQGYDFRASAKGVEWFVIGIFLTSLLVMAVVGFFVFIIHHFY